MHDLHPLRAFKEIKGVEGRRCVRCLNEKVIMTGQVRGHADEALFTTKIRGTESIWWAKSKANGDVIPPTQARLGNWGK